MENTHKKMKENFTPPQNLVLPKIGQIQGGVKFLVDLMKDIIETLKTLEPASSDFVSLKLMNLNSQSLLSCWISVGFGFSSESCCVVENISLLFCSAHSTSTKLDQLSTLPLLHLSFKEGVVDLLQKCA